MSDDRPAPGARDPGDAVPPGVAVERPAPLSESDRKVREQLQRLPERGQQTPGSDEGGARLG